MASTGKAAVIEASTRNPDLVVLDPGLPDVDGLDFLREVCGWSRAPVIVISARVHEEDRVAALDLGADDYITKPFGMSEFMARIRPCLRRAA